MKTTALQFHETNGVDSLRIEEIDRPKPGPNEVLIDVKAFALNRADILYLEDNHYSVASLPSGLGSEATGIIEAIGSNVKGFKVGDGVCTLPHANSTYGVHAQHAVFNADFIAPWQDTLSKEEATSTWMEMLTAYYPLIETAKLTRGDFVLIPAASSSAGLGAIALAKDVGAIVIATTRTSKKMADIFASGADYVVATDEEDLTARILKATNGAGVRVVYDPIGGDFIDDYVEALAENALVFIYGVLRGMHAQVDIVKMVRKAATVIPYSLFNHIRHADQRERGVNYVLERQEKGLLMPKVDKVFGFNDAIAAYRYMLKGEQVGKIVVSTERT
ncbi:zinc-dependent alcohol dehydrogenase family protein [Kordiimonas aquimaris]|uniref:zinc-dependent alcohol dehydrogenase family protein n=1 Tax=Kordiimonas aquimaris TaxID=707591 RepID=UPI0021D37600|nr:zinc-dependent alcohol dehydrogenase family protein [Kordiimonas aquimaris]